MSYTNAELYELQLQRELEAKKDAVRKQKKANDALRAKGQHSKTIGGLALHDRILQSAISLMAEDLNHYFRNQTSVLPKVYQILLNNERVSPFIEPEEMAHISLVTMLDSIGDGLVPQVPLTKVYANIGMRVEDQARMNFTKMVDPKFFERLKKYHLTKTDSYNRKMKAARAEIEYREIDNEELEWDGWSHEEQVAVGSWCAWIIQQSTEWFQEVKLPPSKLDPFGLTKYLMFSKSAVEQRDIIEGMRLEYSYSTEPMICPPIPWTRNVDGTISRGGYIVKPPGNTGKMIHGYDVGTIPGDKALDYLNNIQSQRYRINYKIYELLRYFDHFDLSIGAWKSGTYKLDELRLVDPNTWNLPDTDPEKKQAFRLLMKEKIGQQKHSAQSLSNGTVLDTARELHFYDVDYYYPWFFDTRLRAYPVSQPGPQNVDWHKALLQLADGAPVTKDNFEDVKRAYLIGIANTYGHKKDKLSFDGRVQFAEEYISEHLETILKDPERDPSFSIWTYAEEPFQHLAILMEYNDVILNWRPGILSHVLVGFDATCSGLQLLGSFVRDPETCRLVNVTPSDEPQDAYRAVAEKAKAILSDPIRWKALPARENDLEHGIPIDKIDRSVAKKVVMLIPYGGSYDTLVGHVREATKSWNLAIRDSHTLTKALIQGMDEAVPGFFALNKWFKEVAKLAMAAGSETIKWTTPTGSKIVQSYRQPETKAISTVALGVSNYKEKDHWDSQHSTVIDPNKKGEVNKRKNQTALAANWTHSMDAAVLQEAFHDFQLPFTTVHDCLYAPAGAIPEAISRIREAFVKVTTSDALEQILIENDISLPLPPIGNADVESAIHSEYLFS